jgi:transmembrane sensor
LIKGPEHIDELIGKKLTGEISTEEIILLENWMRQSAKNSQYFDQMVAVFGHTTHAPFPEFDSNTAWNKLQQKIKSNSETPVVQLVPKRSHLFFRIAAAVVVLAGIAGIIALLKNDSQLVFAFQSFNEVVTDSLSDGSIATLNKNTQLEFSVNEQSKERKAKINGEAFFKIKHDEQMTFVIDAGDVFVKDIGTEFNLFAVKGNDTVKVDVTEGIVEAYNLKGQSIQLKAGERGIYLRSKGQFVKESLEEDDNSTAYADKKFVFHGTRLSKAIQKINKVYDTKIVLASESIADCRISVKFKDEDIQTIANVIAETLGLTVEETGGKIILSGNSCR